MIALAESNDPILNTPRTILRRFNSTDLDSMLSLESDASVVKYTPMRVPQDSAATALRLQAVIEKEQALSPLGVWAAELTDTQEFVGWFMLQKSKLEHPELGFMLVKKSWGLGLATEVAAELLKYGFLRLELPVIAATTDPGNSASIRVLQKLGFTFWKTLSTVDKVLGLEIKLNCYWLTRQAFLKSGASQAK